MLVVVCVGQILVVVWVGQVLEVMCAGQVLKVVWARRVKKFSKGKDQTHNEGVRVLNYWKWMKWTYREKYFHEKQCHD